MGEFVVMNHPLIHHKLSILRDRETGVKQFREVVGEIAALMCVEATRDLATQEVVVETPVASAATRRLAGRKLAVVPILRAGLGMLDGVLMLIPSAKVGHIGLYRDPETLNPVDYYCNLPADIENRDVFVLDPMLATGGSACAALTSLKNHGARSLRFLCIISAPEGVEKVRETHPDVDIYTASLDERLNEHGYIVPGLGDAGDRIFGTE